MPRGILDTSTLILLGRLHDTDPLPDEPLITAITLAELSAGPLVTSATRNGLPGKRTPSKPKPTSTRCRSTRPQPAASVGSPQVCEALVGNQRHAPTTP
jgi:hypothetical protein